MRALFATLLTALCFNVAAGEHINSDQLYSMLTSNENIEKANGVGYIIGVFDATYGVLHCTTPGNPAKFVKFVKDVLAEVPAERRKELAGSIPIITILREIGTKCLTV